MWKTNPWATPRKTAVLSAIVTHQSAISTHQSAIITHQSATIALELYQSTTNLRSGIPAFQNIFFFENGSVVIENEHFEVWMILTYSEC